MQQSGGGGTSSERGWTAAKQREKKCTYVTKRNKLTKKRGGSIKWQTRHTKKNENKQGTKETHKKKLK
jgi:hypothetical protein